MITKTETLKFIETVKQKVEKGDKLSKSQAPKIVKDLLKSSKTAEDFYLEFGRRSSNMESEFNNIVFREDCYEYLIELGMSEDKAFELSEIIRKGRYGFLKDTAEYDNFLDNSFKNWAKDVKYLSYRERCMEVFRVSRKFSIAETLDYAIMQTETAKNSEIKSGYKIGNKTYDNYLENDYFDEFIDEMEKKYPIAHEKYGIAGGKELEIRKVGKNIYPPKMASFGSSSRMIFNLMKDTKGFLFEEKLPTTIGGTAHLDGFMETDSKYIFVEAKCREPYGEKDNKVGRKYKELYDFINNSEKSNVSCHIEDIEGNSKEMKVTFKVNDNPIHNFDMKQMISHLLGVATAFLNGRFEIKDIEFIYLLFDPTTIEIKDEKAKAQIYEIYNNTCNERSATDFKGLFEVIVDYLKSYKKWPKNIETSDLTNRFTFKLCSQENIKL